MLYMYLIRRSMEIVSDIHMFSLFVLVIDYTLPEVLWNGWRPEQMEPRRKRRTSSDCFVNERHLMVIIEIMESVLHREQCTILPNTTNCYLIPFRTIRTAECCQILPNTIYCISRLHCLVQNHIILHFELIEYA